MNLFSSWNGIRRPYAQSVSQCGQSVKNGGTFIIEKRTKVKYYFKVGIEDSLHIEFEYNKARYHVEEAIIGKHFFIFQLI